MKIILFLLLVATFISYTWSCEDGAYERFKVDEKLNQHTVEKFNKAMPPYKFLIILDLLAIIIILL